MLIFICGTITRDFTAFITRHPSGHMFSQLSNLFYFLFHLYYLTVSVINQDEAWPKFFPIVVTLSKVREKHKTELCIKHYYSNDVQLYMFLKSMRILTQNICIALHICCSRRKMLVGRKISCKSFFYHIGL